MDKNGLELGTAQRGKPGRSVLVKNTTAADMAIIRDTFNYKVDPIDGSTLIFADVDSAINSFSAVSRANLGDTVYISEGYTETVATASDITSDVAGLSIIGLGEGASRPTFTFSATAATWVVSGASTTIKNIIITNSIDAVVSPFVVSGVDCTFDIESRDSTNLKEFTDIILTTAAADNLKIKLKHVGFTTGSGNTRAVHLVGGNNTRVDVDFYGLATTAVVDFTTAVVDCNVFGYMYNSGTTDFSKSVKDTATGSTWFAEFYDGAAGASVQGGSGNALAAGDLSVIATAVTTTIPGLHAVPGANVTTNTNVRDVVGNKTDTAVGTVAADKSLMGYAKGILEDTGTTLPGTLSTLTGYHTVPTQDAATDAQMRDVVGKKSDTTGGTSLVSLLKVADAAVDAIQTDLGNPSVRTNFQSVETMLGMPDAANSNLDDMIRTGFDSTTVTRNQNGSVMEMLKAIVRVTPQVDMKMIADLTGYDTAAIFNVTGNVVARTYGIVGATAITSTSGTTTLSVGTAGDPDVLLPATTVDNADFAINDVWTDNNPEDGACALSATSWVLISAGEDIILTRNVDDLTAGALSIICEWYSPDGSGSVAAA